MQIKRDDLRSAEVAALLQEHIDDMYATSPPESVHTLDLDRLRQPDITFWTAWLQQDLAGCAALKQLDATHGEIKSMRSARQFRGQGAGKQLLQHLITEAHNRGYQRLSLETGSMAYFDAARNLYRRFGFVECGPFADYQPDPHSVFMTLELNTDCAIR